MGLRKMSRLVLILLLVDLTLAWSKRHPKPTSEDHGKTPIESESSSEEVDSSEEAIESKLKASYTPQPKARQYILEEEDHHYHPHDSANGGGGEYIDSEDLKSHKESEESEGHHDLDSNKKNDEYKEFSEKGAHQEFEQGGASFDQHAKDHKMDNKEVENIKQHDVGAKFGGEAVKEHKLGKHRDKSKGDKSHGFKNVYHKEEYGDHKTFHDEFLDKDTLHDYDDHHEHKEVSGGKFSKGLKHEGRNKKFDKGDAKHQWGKSGYDGSQEGKYDKGRYSSKHQQGTKKRKGHHHADVHNKKHSVHKIKKGNPPEYSPQVGHHGPHQAQIQPYVHHHHSHNVYKEHVPIVHQQSYHDPEEHAKDEYPHDHDDYRNSQEVNYDSKEHHNDDHSTYNSEYRNQHGGKHHPDHHHSGHHNQHHRNHHHHHHSTHHPIQQQEEHDFPHQHEIQAEERIPQKHHSKNAFVKQVEGMHSDGIVQSQEQFNQPSTGTFQPSYHSGFVPYTQHPRRPSFEDRNRKQFHDDEYQRRYHRILYGDDKPRNYHHHSNHPRHHSQNPMQLHGHHHGHHKHDAYKTYHPSSKNYDQSLDARAHSQEHITPLEEQNDRRHDKTGLRRN